MLAAGVKATLTPLVTAVGVPMVGAFGTTSGVTGVDAVEGRLVLFPLLVAVTVKV